MGDENIEIYESTVAEHEKNIQLPLNLIKVGNVDNENIRVYIKQDIYKKIDKFAKGDTTKEVGSILLGDYIEEGGKRYVVISAFIEAKYTDASASTLTFTHETWNYVYREKDKAFPDKKIVGWQHTHPGYGIFLSNYDIFIQENFFNLPWQIAYVVDPIADTRGFFEWRNNKVSKMDGYYVYDELGKNINIEDSSANKGNAKKKITVLTIVLLFLLIIASALGFAFKQERDNIERKMNEVVSQNEEMSADISKLELQISKYENEKANTETEQKEDNTNTDAASTDDASDDNKNIESFVVYTIQSGDTLTSICEKFELDYNEYISKIIKINKMSDVNKIYTGQDIYIPIK